MSTFVRSSRRAGAGTVHFVVSSPHGDDLGVRATVFILNPSHEFSGLSLRLKFQLSIPLRKPIPPLHKEHFDAVHGTTGEWVHLVFKDGGGIQRTQALW